MFIFQNQLLSHEKNLNVFTAQEFSSLCRSTMINPKVFYESDLDVGVLLNTFFINTWENDTWPELEWLTEKQ